MMLLGLEIVGAFGGRKCSEDFADYDAVVSARGGLAHKVLELDENPGSGSASERTSQSRQLMLPVGKCQGPGKLLSGFLPILPRNETRVGA